MECLGAAEQTKIFLNGNDLRNGTNFFNLVPLFLLSYKIFTYQ